MMNGNAGGKGKPTPPAGAPDWSQVDRYLANIPAAAPELPPLPNIAYPDAATEVIAPSYPHRPSAYPQALPPSAPYPASLLGTMDPPTVSIAVPGSTPAPYAPLPPGPPPVPWDAPTVAMSAGSVPPALDRLVVGRDPIAPPPMRAVPVDLSDSPSDDALFEALFPEDEQPPKPLVDDLVLAQEELPSVTDAALWGETGELRPMVESRRGERFECDPPIASKLQRQDARVSNGEVRSISSGGLFLSVENAPLLETALVVTFVRGDGQKLSIGGRVVYRPKDGLGVAIRLSSEVRARAFVLSFIDFVKQKRAGIQRSEILVREVDQSEVDPEDPIEANTEEAALNRAWASAKANLDDKKAQQEFVNQCVTLQRIDFALECYRKLHSEHPDDERIKKYLTNVGTVLSFYVLKPSSKTQESNQFFKLPSAGKLLLYVAVLLALVTLTLIVRAKDRLTEEDVVPVEILE
ncbi:MAG: PilZ domain-containing protein [Deltaproteobacteria bacterium]|nr:PilZ domain-containing protein [Deltaproteobacteria bacterium]